MKSKGYFLIKYGKPEQAFDLKEFVLSNPNIDEITIEVESFGLNFADVMARKKLYKEAPPLPCILGYDVVGKVIKVGDDSNKNWIGKRVLAFTRFGGYSQHVNTKINAIVEVSDLDSNIALALGTQYVTAYYMAEYLSPIHENDKVLIHAAAGGVGSALIQFAKRKKAIVYAKIGSKNKEVYVKKLGADFVIDYSVSDYELQLKALLKNEKIDTSFNAVAGATLKKDIRLLGSGGKLILFGGAERTNKKWGIFSTLNFVCKMGIFLPIVLMMKSKSILGVNMLKIADNKPQILNHCLHKVMELFREGSIQPKKGKSFSADNLSKAHLELESGNSIGKISIDWS
jgi:NADPH:quinone reductase-like Zn-dependent oxidoreductase